MLLGERALSWPKSKVLPTRMFNFPRERRRRLIHGRDDHEINLMGLVKPMYEMIEAIM